MERPPNPLRITSSNQPWFAVPVQEPDMLEDEPKYADDHLIQSPEGIFIRTDVENVADRFSYFSQTHEPRHPHTERLAKAFTSRFQLHKILFENFTHWMLNVSIILLIFGALKYYENKGNTWADEKHWFNTIITGLQVALALSFFSSLKELAKILRWRVLARKGHTMREFDLILSGDSLMKLATLWIHHARDICYEIWTRTPLQHIFSESSFSKHLSPSLKYIPTTPRSPHFPPPRIREQKSILDAAWSITKINMWIAINVLAQVAIAMIGLTYGVQSGTPIIPAPYSESGAWQTDLSYVYPLNFQSNSTPGTINSEEAASHLLGDVGTIMSEIDISDPNDPLTYQGEGASAYYYVNDGDNSPYFMYRYYSYDASDYFHTTWSVPTNRTVTTSWANCEQMPVIQGGDGNSYNMKYILPNGTVVEFGLTEIGPGVTAYIYTAAFSDCTDPSPRCARIMAFQAKVGDFEPFVYKCDITVNGVDNAAVAWPQQQIQDEQARNLSAAAALTGFGTRITRYTINNQPTWWQANIYTNDSYWSLVQATGVLSGDQAGAHMAEFAIAAIAAMANFNPRRLMPGPYPLIGVLLTVEWKWVRILLPGIAGAHLALFLLVVFITSPYVVRDDSNLANALLLRPVVERVGPPGKGGCLSGHEIATIIDDAGRRFAYSAVKTQLSGSGQPQYRLSIHPVDGGGRHSSISGTSLRSEGHGDGWYE